MSKIRRKRRSSNGVKRKRSRGGVGRGIPTNIPIDEPRECPCPLHETFWVTLPSPQVYAFPACRKRAYDVRKKQAFMAFLYERLVYVGTALERAAEIARRVVQRFYTRTVKMVQELGVRYDSKRYQWIKVV